MTTIQEALNLAISAIDRGDIEKAKSALGWVLTEDPYNKIALLWMPTCLTDERAKNECYKRLAVS